MKYIFLILILKTVVTLSCKNNEVFLFNEKKEPECLACDKNCEVCELNAKNIAECLFCNQGYFIKDGGCKKCIKNCQQCSGDTLEMCHNLEPGFFYNAKKQKLNKCKIKGCAFCFSDTYCLNCKEGFFAQKMNSEKNKKNEKIPDVNNLKLAMEMINRDIPENSEDPVRCFPCNIKDCLYCSKEEDQIKNSNYLKCNLCKTGFSIISNKCVMCPKNCAYCKDGSAQCSACKRGFHLNEIKNTCEKITIGNCYSSENGTECDSCDSHFFLSEDKKTCETCVSKVDKCNFCNKRKEKDFNCYSCIRGYSYNKVEKKCDKCIENCEYCREKKCTFCVQGFFLEKGSDICQKCEIENCMDCDTADKCGDCLDTFFFNSESKKCEKCDNNCLECSGKKDNCTLCPIDYFKFSEEIVIHKKENLGIFSNFLNFDLGALGKIQTDHKEIQTQIKCLKECPKTYEGRKVIIDLSQMRCIVSLEENEKKPEKHLNPLNFKGNLIERLKKLKRSYFMTINKQSSLKKLLNNDEDKSADCNFNGVIKREIRGIFDNYQFCKCDVNFIGDFCNIPLDFFKSVQKELAKILNKIGKSFKVKGKHKIKKFLRALSDITEMELSLPIIQKMINIMVLHLQEDPEIENKEKLFMIFDKLLLKLLEKRDDQKKKKKDLIQKRKIF